MPAQLLDRIEQWKARYGSASVPLERLLAAAARGRWTDPADLIRLHELLLFLRAYPHSPSIARLADAILFSFHERTAGLTPDQLLAFEEPEVSGIAGTSLTAVFSYEVARRLSLLHPRDIDIDWDRYDDSDRLGPTLRGWLPLLAEDWLVEAHIPYRQWVRAANPGVRSGLSWLLAHPHAAESYEALGLPLVWRMGRGRTTRSRQRLPRPRLFCHAEPLLRRKDVSLSAELASPPLPIRRVSRGEARRILDLILDTSAMRFRELHGFSHPDEGGVFRAEAGRGVEIYFFGVPPRWRLPLRAYHAGMFFKNGVPAGYVEVLSLFDRSDVGFNLYYTFREGESAWLFARILHLFRQVLGVHCFSVDPYQIGWENPEAVDSGAFWFYRKLGFRPTDPEVAAITAREEKRMAQTPEYRSSPRTLQQLARGFIVFEAPQAEPGAWDGFRVRSVGLAVQRAIAGPFAGDLERFRKAVERHLARTVGFVSSGGLAMAVSLIPDLASWTAEERSAVGKILRSKEIESETQYVRRLQRHPRLRHAIRRLGSSPPALDKLASHLLR